MGQVAVWALVAALNPTLLAATTVMLLLPRPERLMFGYWLGAMLVAISIGLVIVFALENSSVVSTTKNTVGPAANFVLAAICVVLAGVLSRGHGKTGEERNTERGRAGKKKGTPRWRRQLGKGSARTTFVIGALLSLPGGSYLIGLGDIHKLHYSTGVTVLVVIGFNLVQQLLLEVPMVAFKVAPEQTPILIERVTDWGRARGRAFAASGLLVIGVLFAIKGIVEVI